MQDGRARSAAATAAQANVAATAQATAAAQARVAVRTSGQERRAAYVAKTRMELEMLAARGVVVCGNAFSSVLIVKGELSADELAGGPLLAGPDGDALRKSLTALGYAPEDWAGLSALAGKTDGAAGGGVAPAPLTPGLFRTAVAALGPSTVLICDNAAATTFCAAYAIQPLEPGVVTDVLGMRVLHLGGFAAGLADPQRKQWAWACLKRVPPLGEPY